MLFDGIVKARYYELASSILHLEETKNLKNNK